MKEAKIFGLSIAAVTMQEAVAAAKRMIENGRPSLIVTANAEMLMRATHDEELYRVLEGADIVVPDGAGTVWAAHTLGYEMPERVAGFDLVQELMRLAPAQGWRIYLFGSAPGVAEAAKAEAERLYPGIAICGVRNGFFTEEDEPEIVAEIKEAKPHIFLAALGVPKQEKWLDAHMEEIGAPLSIGVGGTLDVMAGVMKRAPLWMQKAKLEWLFRGLMQPKRAGRLLALPKFVMKVYAEKAGTK
ncbi:WecB/TagA/CpsF family glycosyltransferase [Selenomonas sp. TAMA-11512]|uniref:WecB/TagA/CpsF family glycosyltransferase n=1 Tax=Selenomonas sp. TAMA-11512 TaxID=3095337 RepID=UPI00308BA0D9|nr:WecB/TagA/CpsF family glycosyltransferase [Selenomonas sp. TAMA-11512]